MSLVNQSQPASTPASFGRTAALVAGDAVAFLVFSAIGRASHAEAAGLDAIIQVVETAAPFLVGWFAAAPLLGAYRQANTSTIRGMLARTAVAWVVAWPIGLGLRALIRQAGIPLSFALVTFVTVLIILALWRGLFALVAARRA